MPPLILLIHSPLVGPATWNTVARRLRSRGWRVTVPRLMDDGAGHPPYWQQHVASVIATFLRRRDQQAPLIAVAHSGAGYLLPSIAALVKEPLAAQVFVDAGIPRDGASRLEPRLVCINLSIVAKRAAVLASRELPGLRAHPPAVGRQS